MSEDRVTEKVYCYDHTSAYNNHDALAIASMSKKDTDPMAMMAATNGGMGGQWNNPFVYFVWMMFSQRMWGNGWNNGQNLQNAELQD